jgi:hypothetical protein
MVAFLDCLRQLGDFAEAHDANLKLPYKSVSLLSCCPCPYCPVRLSFPVVLDFPSRYLDHPLPTVLMSTSLLCLVFFLTAGSSRIGLEMPVLDWHLIRTRHGRGP